jgi:hypothetical protein
MCADWRGMAGAAYSPGDRKPFDQVVALRRLWEGLTWAKQQSELAPNGVSTGL